MQCAADTAGTKRSNNAYAVAGHTSSPPWRVLSRSLRSRLCFYSGTQQSAAASPSCVSITSNRDSLALCEVALRLRYAQTCRKLSAFTTRNYVPAQPTSKRSKTRTKNEYECAKHDATHQSYLNTLGICCCSMRDDDETCETIADVYILVGGVKYQFITSAYTKLTTE